MLSRRVDPRALWPLAPSARIFVARCGGGNGRLRFWHISARSSGALLRPEPGNDGPARSPQQTCTESAAPQAAPSEHDCRTSLHAGSTAAGRGGLYGGRLRSHRTPWSATNTSGPRPACGLRRARAVGHLRAQIAAGKDTVPAWMAVSVYCSRSAHGNNL